MVFAHPSAIPIYTYTPLPEGVEYGPHLKWRLETQTPTPSPPTLIPKDGGVSPCFALVGSWPSPSYLSSPGQIPGGALGRCTETASSLRAAWRGRGCRVAPRRASPLPGCSPGVCTWNWSHCRSALPVRP